MLFLPIVTNPESRANYIDLVTNDELSNVSTVIDTFECNTILYGTFNIVFLESAVDKLVCTYV